MGRIQKIGFGGGCHWCTEAVFQSLIGVEQVEQGWIASEGEAATFSEAVIVHYRPEEIALAVLVEIHLYTHKSTSQHSMREKYRSAIYYFDHGVKESLSCILEQLNPQFDHQLITQILPFTNFKASREALQNYYYSNPKKPFCETFINPKLKLLLQRFSEYADHVNLEHLNKRP
ncbi:MAG: peptide-methionine (S)-S-oxide reductase [Bacteroidota bacterium]